MIKLQLQTKGVNTITNEVIIAVKDIFGEKLNNVILFGSYACGDFDNDSDVDIFVLADIPQEETNQWNNRIDDLLSDLWLNHDLLVCVHLTSKSKFDRYYSVLPYYQNVIKEGIELYG